MNLSEHKEYIQRELYNIDLKLANDSLTVKELGVCLGVLFELQKIQKDPEIAKRIKYISQRLNSKTTESTCDL